MGVTTCYIINGNFRLPPKKLTYHPIMKAFLCIIIFFAVFAASVIDAQYGCGYGGYGGCYACSGCSGYYNYPSYSSYSYGYPSYSYGYPNYGYQSGYQSGYHSYGYHYSYPYGYGKK
ncbi:hypothetical protein QR680_015342 [Steinernema hermaphroditum]|uniref:Uncharacterized protein n=1 Tax=Steinernema hermaphroditum TaxID=289476 RepID=A0AA39LK24_9BILA|nr:hypothetical protein QR680_015342 [Steinernema hermaphroditum]